MRARHITSHVSVERWRGLPARERLINCSDIEIYTGQSDFTFAVFKKELGTVENMQQLTPEVDAGFPNMKNAKTSCEKIK